MTITDSTSAGTTPRLRTNALGFPQLLAQSVALISPTMTAVLIIPLAFSIAGDATWFSYAFGTIMLLFVVFGLNQFAKRSSTTGSMYAYVARGLGAASGVMTGWALVWCYFFIGTAGLCGFALMSQQFLDGLGVHGTVTPLLFFLISAAVGFYIAFRDVRLSAVLMLVLEGLSVACILALSAVILFKHGFHVDTAETSLHGFGLKSLDFSVVVCIFSLVGFEAASTMGGEARNPLKNVPKAVIWSLIVTGLFMVVMSYVEVLGASHSHLDLASLGAPLQTLSSAYGVAFFKIPGLTGWHGQLLRPDPVLCQLRDAHPAAAGPARLRVQAAAQHPCHQPDPARRDRLLLRPAARRGVHLAPVRHQRADHVQTTPARWRRPASCSPTS